MARARKNEAPFGTTGHHPSVCDHRSLPPAAAIIEDAKRISECIWVIRHAMQCTSSSCHHASEQQDDEEDDDYDHHHHTRATPITASADTEHHHAAAAAASSSSLPHHASSHDQTTSLASCRASQSPGARRRTSCTVAGCETAKLVLRVIEEQEKGELGIDALPQGSALEAACHFVRSVLHHCATCPWAAPGGASPDEPPCLLCALVSRARATPTRDHLMLSFATRAKCDSPDFTVPDHTSTLRRRDASSFVDCPPELRRSNTTEELALLLSDLSRRPDGVAAKLSSASYARDAPPSSSSRHNQSTDEDDDDAADVASLPCHAGGLRRRPAPQLQCNESTEDEDAADQSSLSPFREYRRRELVEVPEHMAKRARIAHRSQRTDDGPKPHLRIATSSPRAVPPPRAAAVLPRSPSFSAAASSLLALTSSKPRAPGQPRTGPMVSDARAPPLLMPQC